ncbi:MAG: mechanosensitive ion channel family protein [Elusimicrobiota bacterium]
MFPNGFFRQEYFDNPVSAYILAGATFLGAVWAFMVLRRVATRVRPSLASELIDQVRAHELVVVALDFAVRSLDLPTRLEHALHVVTVLVVAYRVVGLLSTIARFSIHKAVLSESSVPADVATAQTATLAVRGLIWLAAVLFTLSSLGYNVTSMLAGLGIGGIAVALAAQAVLGDLFASVAIHLDKPFVVGDMIKVADFFGTVERIGIKTTRVRSLGGEILIYPNSALTTTRIQNFRRMTERRIELHFAVPLGTPTETLKKIPTQVAAVVNRTPNLRFGRAHLSLFQESSFQYEVIFFVLSPDYAVYMDAQQDVLLGVLESLRADGIDLAQPTTVMIPGKPV